MIAGERSEERGRQQREIARSAALIGPTPHADRLRVVINRIILGSPTTNRSPALDPHSALRRSSRSPPRR
jgi:hypothetical protein